MEPLLVIAVVPGILDIDAPVRSDIVLQKSGQPVGTEAVVVIPLDVLSGCQVLDFSSQRMLFVKLVENVEDDNMRVPHSFAQVIRSLEGRIVGLEGIESLHLKLGREGFVYVYGRVPEIEYLVSGSHEGVVGTVPLGIIGVNLQAALASEQGPPAEVVGDVHLASNLIDRMGEIRIYGGQGVGVLLSERRGVVDDFVNAVHRVA